MNLIFLEEVFCSDRTLGICEAVSKEIGDNTCSIGLR
jgi:hypothetical protein